MKSNKEPFIRFYINYVFVAHLVPQLTLILLYHFIYHCQFIFLNYFECKFIGNNKMLFFNVYRERK